MKKKSVPATANARGDSKTARIQPVAPAHFPSWRFSTVDKGGPFPWPKNKDEELLIVQKLHDFDSMMWSRIEGPDHHAISQESLSKEARQRLEEIGQDDIDEVFSFHFSGKKRIIGIREFGAIRLLWWDPEHGVCPSVKKHT